MSSCSQWIFTFVINSFLHHCVIFLSSQLNRRYTTEKLCLLEVECMPYFKFETYVATSLFSGVCSTNTIFLANIPPTWPHFLIWCICTNTTLNVQILCIKISICERNYKGSLNIFVYKNPVASITNFEGLQKIHSWCRVILVWIVHSEKDIIAYKDHVQANIGVGAWKQGATWW